MSTRVFAPAKINLTLSVAQARADGMHALQSAVMFADVGDWVEAEAQPASSFGIRGPFAASLTDAPSNLVLDAFAALAEAGAVDHPAALTLDKQLPVASGIGGGSSDAAAALKALRALWALDLDDAALMRIGERLGADVPVCIAARSAWMTGVGEHVAPLTAPVLDAVLLNPGMPLSTGTVFRTFDAMGLGAGFTPTAAPVWRTPEEAIVGAATLGNDLEAPAMALMPEIGDIAALLRADSRVRHAGLSGSGATLFALVEHADAAHSLARDLSARSRDWWVRPTRLGALDASRSPG